MQGDKDISEHRKHGRDLKRHMKDDRRGGTPTVTVRDGSFLVHYIRAAGGLRRLLVHNTAPVAGHAPP